MDVSSYFLVFFCFFIRFFIFIYYFFLQCCDKKYVEFDVLIVLYYECFVFVQLCGCQVIYQVLKDIFREVQFILVLEVFFKEWVQYMYQDFFDYWIFRKQVCEDFLLVFV